MVGICCPWPRSVLVHSERGQELGGDERGRLVVAATDDEEHDAAGHRGQTDADGDPSADV